MRVTGCKFALERVRARSGNSDSRGSFLSGPSASLVIVRIASSARLANGTRRLARSRAFASMHPRNAERKSRGSQQT